MAIMAPGMDNAVRVQLASTMIAHGKWIVWSVKVGSILI
jgi:hypothetical protein